MTTSVHPDQAVRRRRFHLHCSCGATIASSEATATCSECGSVVTFRGATFLRKDLITYIRLVGKELPLIVGWPLFIALSGYFAGIEGAILAFIASAIAFGIYKADVSSPRRQASRASDPTMRYRWMGRLILVAATFLVLVYSIPASNYHEWMAIAKHPKPHDCDFAVPPFGDKHCRYEASFTTSSEGGGKLTVDWNRMSD